MTTELTTTYKPLDEYLPEQIRAYKRALKIEDCSSDEWELLKIQSAAYGLNPFLKEIWLIPGIGVTVGHAGLIQMAIRSGNYNGIHSESFDQDGKPYRGLSGQKLTYSTAVVSLRSGGTVEKTVLFSEVNRGGSGRSNWDKMPRVMLEKVAETHALRRAFGFSGCYIPEELGTNDISQDPAVVIDVTPEPSQANENTPKIDPTKCPRCGGVPMNQYDKNRMAAAFDRDHVGEVPEGICINCANAEWRKRMGIPEPTTKEA